MEIAIKSHSVLHFLFLFLSISSLCPILIVCKWFNLILNKRITIDAYVDFHIAHTVSHLHNNRQYESSLARELDFANYQGAMQIHTHTDKGGTDRALFSFVC